jgi:uncharacterized SAM-binding protein YcdF (DUF218 family)
LKLLLKGGLFIIFIGIIIVVVIAANIIIGFSTMKPVKSDCIIVLGCKVNGLVPSPFLISRVDEGIRLYRLGYGEVIIMSGGQGNGENISEAAAMRNYAISQGISPKKILEDNTSTNTLTNLINSKKIMSENNLGSAIIVSNKYHIKRASLIAKELGIKSSYSGVFNSKYKIMELSGFLREILATGKFYLFNE